MNALNVISLVTDLILKSTAVLGAAFLLALILRRASAANRHLIWLTAFIILAVLPCTEGLAPRWNIQLPAIHLLRQTLSSETGQASLAAIPVSATHQSLNAEIAATFVIVWAGGFLFLLSRLAIGRILLLRLAKRTTPFDSPRASAFVNGLENAPTLSLRQSSEIRVPMTYGTLRPAILLPSDAINWPDAQLRAALLHECGHAARRDCLARLIGQCVCAMFWLHPLVWLASRRMRLAQEEACDEIVIRAGLPAEDYASQLLHMTRGGKWLALQSIGALAMADVSTLGTRVAAIVDKGRNRKPAGRKAAAGALAAAAIAIPLITIVKAGRADDTLVTRTWQSRPPSGPVDIRQADETSFSHGIAIAKGHVQMRYGGITVKADEIVYDPMTRKMIATGHASYTYDDPPRQGGYGDKLIWNLQTQTMTVEGDDSISELIDDL